MTDTSDLTIIYSTAHKIPEDFAKNILDKLYESAGDYPVVENHCKPEESSINNYYRSLLRVAKQIKTPYIAFAEDDTLYPDEHFNYRSEVFAYNFTRWNLYTWSQPPFFSLMQRKIIGTLICPTDLFIEVYEERFNKYQDPPERWMGEPGRHDHEKALGITLRDSEEFNTYNPIVVFSHEDSFGFETTGTNKRASKIRALALPYWGTVDEVRRLYANRG